MRQLVISQSITQRESRSLDKYFHEVDRIRLLTLEQEITLAGKIRTGDRAALDTLVAANLRFVISVAKQYQFQGLTLGDLINEGNIGLMIAAQRYDETKGFKFISYAVWWIRQSIITAISRQARMIRLPYNRLSLLNRFHRAVSDLEQEHGRKPSHEELASTLQVGIDTVSELFSKYGTQVSFDEPFKPQENHSLLDILANAEPGTDSGLTSDAIKKEIKYSMNCLSTREKELLVLFFGLDSHSPLTMEEIGRRFDITKEHAGRIKTKALTKLRNCSRASILLSCLT
jgi:RNA polymerase primary sigma factor